MMLGTTSTCFHLNKIPFADNYPRGKQAVDVLIGQNFELEFATSEPKVLGPRETPGAVKTKLGWILCVSLDEVQQRNETRTMRVQTSNEDEHMRRMFEIESTGTENNGNASPLLRDQ